MTCAALCLETSAGWQNVAEFIQPEMRCYPERAKSVDLSAGKENKRNVAKRNGTERNEAKRNGTEWKGMEQNGTE